MIDQQWSEQAAAPRLRSDPAPLWPFLLSLALMAGYFAFGYFIPVGPNCSAVFGDQTSALTADTAAMRGGRYTTDWVGACTQAAASQAPLCWILLALGAVTAIVGLALRQSMRGKAAAPVVAGDGRLAEDLARLAALRGSGALSPEEYEAAKSRLLGATGTP